jgi:hypothetical protein
MCDLTLLKFTFKTEVSVGCRLKCYHLQSPNMEVRLRDAKGCPFTEK